MQLNHRVKMKKSLLFVLLAIAAGQFTYGQKLSKEEEKQLKDELKGYMKNLASYKAKMDGIRATLDSNEAEIKGLKADTVVSAAVQTELENKVFNYEEQIKNLRTENDSLKTMPPLAAAAAAESSPEKGTTFKVQLGMYKALDLTRYFQEPRFIGYEQVDGMNRYVISFFPDEETAQSFVTDIRKLGIKDAFVAKYIDGTRVYEWDNNPKYKGKKAPESLNEALEMNNKGKK